MRNQNPLANIAILRAKADNAFLGSCFVFRYPPTFLTAQHCVASLDSAALTITLPMIGRTYAVASITPHQTADIAILYAPEVNEDDVTSPHYLVCDDRDWGQEYMSCGYPQDYTATGPNPAPRVFHGHVQRFMDHTSHLGYSYFAAELSTGCPRGLSGAPVFNPRFHGRLYGLITENIKTTTELESVVEVENNGVTYREHYHNIINYGVALWLPALASWVDATVPPLTNDEINRRAANQQRINALARGGT